MQQLSTGHSFLDLSFMAKKKTLIYLIVLFVSLVGLQCKTTQETTSQRVMYKAIYIEQFKLTYFRQILTKSYNNSNAIQEIVSSDHSGFTEPILTDLDYKLIDSLTTADNEKMKIDSAEGNRRAEGAQGKRSLGFILDRLNSKWLDSIANKQYKKSGVKKMYDD
jgi:hypothetical protein